MADHPVPRSAKDRRAPPMRWERLDPEEAPPPPPRSGFGAFIGRLGRLFQMHPRGPFGS